MGLFRKDRPDKDTEIGQMSLFDFLENMGNDNPENALDPIEEDPVVNLFDIDNYCDLYNFIQDILPYYINEHPEADSKKIMSFMKHVIHSMEAFAAGQASPEFQFSFSLRAGNELNYFSIENYGNQIIVNDGGHIYDPMVGGDSFTNWMWEISNDGEAFGSFYLNLNEVLEMINLGAELEIDEPEEFIINTEND